MWGRTAEEALGRTCRKLGYEPWHAEIHAREIDQVRATRQPIRGEVPFDGAFGRRMYTPSTCSCMANARPTAAKVALALAWRW